MNDLSNKVLSQVSGIKDFFNGLGKDDKKLNYNPIEQKVFHLYQSDGEIQKKKKKNHAANSQGTNKSIDLHFQTSFSLRDIQ